MNDITRTSKELAYRDALARIRQICRSSPKDFVAAATAAGEAYHIANRTLDAHGELFVTAHEPPAAPMKMHVDYEWQKQRLESGGPAEECAAGGPSKPVTTGCIWEDCDQEAIYCAGHAREFAAPTPPPAVVQDMEGIAWCQKVHEDLALYVSDGGGQMIDARAHRALGIMFTELEKLEKALWPLTK